MQDPLNLEEEQGLLPPGLGIHHGGVGEQRRGSSGRRPKLNGGWQGVRGSALAVCSFALVLRGAVLTLTSPPPSVKP